MKSIKTTIAAIATLASTIAFGGGLYLVANSDFNMPSLVYKINVTDTTSPTRILVSGNENSLMFKIDDGTVVTNVKNQALSHTFARSGEHVIKVYSISRNTTVNLPPECTTEVVKLRPLLMGKYRQLLVAPPCSGSETLTKLYLPEGIDRVYSTTYQYCINLVEASLPSTVQYLGGYSFKGCSNLVQIALGDDLRRIDQNAFQDCTSLKSIVVPNSVTNMGLLAFCNCTSMTSAVVGVNVKRLEKQAFYNNKNLEHLELSPQLEFIGDYVFFHCDKLREIDIPSTTTYIGTQAFAVCVRLGKVTIGSPDVTIGESAFTSCSALTNIVTQLPTATVEENAKNVWKVRSGCVINCSDGDFTVP